MSTKQKLNIWVDIASAPQLMFFSSVIPELKARGHNVFATAFGFDGCADLLECRNVKAEILGVRYQVGHKEMVRNLIWNYRRLKLRHFIAKYHFDIAASYGSSTQAEVAGQLSIPLFTGTDYEHVRLTSMRHASRVMIPKVVPKTKFVEAGVAPEVIHQYPGQKEHVYLHRHSPVADLRSRFGIREDEFLILFRPESQCAHYLDQYAADFPSKVLADLLKRPNVRILLLPRTKWEYDRFKRKFKHKHNVQVIDQVICGPAFIAASDLLVGGGGTMIREAAVLGVPAASCFEGPLGAIDRDLVRQGKLELIKSLGDIERLKFERRKRQEVSVSDTSIRDIIVNGICETVR
ncbi:DUF354 domain-containing protein [Pseudomonadota bacterium]